MHGGKTHGYITIGRLHELDVSDHCTENDKSLLEGVPTEVVKPGTLSTEKRDEKHGVLTVWWMPCMWFACAIGGPELKPVPPPGNGANETFLRARRFRMITKTRTATMIQNTMMPINCG